MLLLSTFVLLSAATTATSSATRSFAAATAGLSESMGLLQPSTQPIEERTQPRVDYFLANYTAPTGHAVLGAAVPEWVGGVEHFRLIPGVWYPEMSTYHFDGLAMVIKFVFRGNKNVSWFAEPYRSEAYNNFDSCLFFGNGVTSISGLNLCFENPAVNILPIRDQLWLTIDTSSWGRVDKDTLATIRDATVDVNSLVLNAHPACDRAASECFVQHPCSANRSPWTDQACVSLLRTSGTGLVAIELGRATLPRKRLIQHSHSPCVTPGFVVTKIDAFEVRNDIKEGGRGGVLKLLHQGEVNEWLLFSRATNETTVLTSKSSRNSPDHSFVNNHFWNCYEEDGSVVVETVATTSDYLDSYFADNLAADMDWTAAFQSPLRCRVPTGRGENVVKCAALSPEFGPETPFDYPTFNPHFKMRPDYRFFYAIASSSGSSKWFDRLIKVDVSDASGGKTVASWSEDGTFLTEADFVPRTQSIEPGAEDDGLLLSVLHDVASGMGSLGVFDAATLELLDRIALGGMVPFHAHGVVCKPGEPCFANP